jgi:pimeloyl-ACP methyl ester carboxylesterase
MATTNHTYRNSSNRSRVLWIILVVATAALAVGSAVSSRVHAGTFRATADTAIRIRTIHYRSHDGVRRSATVILPEWYGPGKNPPVPLVISPQGRNVDGRENAGYWGTLPAAGGFAVVNPDGMGRRLPIDSYGYTGQIDDLARMPEILTAALPWLRIDRRRIFAVGSSMGGQETLLLVARHPDLLAGAAAMDSVTDLARRYRQMPQLHCSASCLHRFGQPYGVLLQQKLAGEVGASPARNARLYSERSPLRQAERIAASGVPLQIWWSTKDRVVFDQAHQSRALYRELRRLDRCAPVSAFVGSWRHSHEMRSNSLLPIALVRLGLLPSTDRTLPRSVTYSAEASCSAQIATRRFKASLPPPRHGARGGGSASRATKSRHPDETPTAMTANVAISPRVRAARHPLLAA